MANSYFKTTRFGNVKSVWVLYWQDSQNKYNRNNFWNDLEEYYLKHIVYSKFQTLTDFDFRQSNTNRKTQEWAQNKHWVENHRNKKTKGYPLVLINGGQLFHVKDDSSSKAIETLYEELSERMEP